MTPRCGGLLLFISADVCFSDDATASKGLPVIVHQSFDTKHAKDLPPGSTPRTLPLALFLLAQTDYWYLGISSGWMDKDWSWYPEYVRGCKTVSPPASLHPACLSNSDALNSRS